MKKLYFVIVVLMGTSLSGFTQNVATPNPGFENWTQIGNRYDPDNWNTLNPNTAIIGVLTCTRASGADVHSGTYAIKLTTKSVFGVTANGIASTATLITTPPYGVTGGIPYTERPDSIVGWYKCAPATASDSGFVQFILLGAANDTIGYSRFTFPNTAVNSYTRFSKPITYFSPATPTLSYWILSSSDGFNPVVNSAIFVDDIDLIFNPSGLTEQNQVSQFNLVSNLVKDDLVLDNTSGKVAQMIIFENSGRIVGNLELSTGNNSFDLRHFVNGIYYYEILQPGNSKSVYGKIVKL